MSFSLDNIAAAIPQLVPNVDWHRLPLTPEQGFLLSRIDGRTSVTLLTEMTGMPLSSVTAALVHLQQLGAIQVEAAAPSVHPSLANANVRQVAPFTPVFEEDCDLSSEEQEEILKTEYELDQMPSHWQTLGLCGVVSLADIKRAYYLRSRRFHPDRYFGRELGKFQGRLDRIFKAIKTAYDVLCDEDSRRLYAETTPPPASLETIAKEESPAQVESQALTEKARQDRLERYRQTLMAERRERQVPIKFSPMKAHQYYIQSEKLQAQGQVARALKQLELACAHEPTNALYRQARDDANRLLSRKRAEAIAKRAEEAVASGHSMAAAMQFEMAFENAPSQVAYALQAAASYVAAGEIELAVQMLDRARLREPNHPDLAAIAQEISKARALL